MKGREYNSPPVIGHGGIGIAVKFRKPVDILPDGCAVGVKNMGTVGMYLNTLGFFCINITADMGAFVDHQNPFACIGCLPGKDGAEQARTDHIS